MSRPPIRIALIVGTRPEAIKLAPIVLAARARLGEFSVRVIRTGPHRALVDEVLEEFDVQADADLRVMKPGQDLAHVMAESVRGLSTLFCGDRPDWVLVQGDTTTTLAGALAAFYNRVPVGHVEAGLRTGDRYNPFPEEMNRLMTSRLATLHFAPTGQGRQNLMAEGVAQDDIRVTGNTVVDALYRTLARPAAAGEAPSERYVLVTAHRRESQGAALGHICDGILGLLASHPALVVWVPMHPSPEVRRQFIARLGAEPRVRLTEPLGYGRFVRALNGAALVLTDSGGVQEECAAMGKPVLVMRDNTERAEGVHAGVAMLVGTDARRIIEAATALLNDPVRYAAMAVRSSAYGDGTASEQILNALVAAPA